MSEPTTTSETETAKKYSRDDIRTAFLDAKPQNHPLEVFGVKVLLVEPRTNDLLALRDSEDKKAAMAQMMISYVRTEDGQPVFDEADAEGIMNMPFGKDMQKLSKAINELVGASEPSDDTKS